MAQLFLDCDGVLADFDRGARQVLGAAPRQFEAAHGLPEFWRRLARTPDFYATLPLMPDAMQLYQAVGHLNPVILTGCPRGQWAQAQKERWVRRHFPGVRLITCMAADKRRYANNGDVLVDDTLKYRHLWEQAGGIFVHHTSAKATVECLKQLGVLAWQDAAPDSRLKDSPRRQPLQADGAATH